MCSNDVNINIGNSVVKGIYYSVVISNCNIEDFLVKRYQRCGEGVIFRNNFRNFHHVFSEIEKLSRLFSPNIKKAIHYSKN